MFGLFRKKPKETSNQYAYAPGTKIAFDPELVDGLKDDHQKLLELYTKVCAFYDKQDLDNLRTNLLSFKVELTSHLLRENTKLYVYLKSKFDSDPNNRELVTDMQREMGKIGHDVFQFLRDASQPDMVFDSQFKAQLDQIGAILVTRIKAEEDMLYELYTPIENI
jgi:iron-sulfur cluster repair protein YtfE (RIC family)